MSNSSPPHSTMTPERKREIKALADLRDIDLDLPTPRAWREAICDLLADLGSREAGAPPKAAGDDAIRQVLAERVAELESRIERAEACFRMAKRQRTALALEARIEQALAILRGEDPR